MKKRRRQFWKKKGKKKEKKWEIKHVGKVKAKFLTSSILKKINKDNLKTKHVGKYCSKTKTMWGNIVAKQKPCGETL
jgi:hypothetical protein